MDKIGYIPVGVVPSKEWYIIDSMGRILHSGGECAPDYKGWLKPGNLFPEGWKENCSRWFDTLEELCECYTVEML